MGIGDLRYQTHPLGDLNESQLHIDVGQGEQHKAVSLLLYLESCIDSVAV